MIVICLFKGYSLKVCCIQQFGNPSKVYSLYLIHIITLNVIKYSRLQFFLLKCYIFVLLKSLNKTKIPEKNITCSSNRSKFQYLVLPFTKVPHYGPLSLNTNGAMPSSRPSDKRSTLLCPMCDTINESPGAYLPLRFYDHSPLLFCIICQINPPASARLELAVFTNNAY